MKTLYLKEHLDCFNYEKNKSQSIELKKISKGELWTTSNLEYRLLFVLEGSLLFESGSQKAALLNNESFIFIPSNTEIVISAQKNAQVLIFQIEKRMQLCSNYSLEQLIDYKPTNKSVLKEIQSLEICTPLQSYLNQVKLCLDHELRCRRLFEIKMEELFLMLRAFYSKEQLAIFFTAMLSPDISFSDYIIQNHGKYQTLGELAEAMNYSLSGFEKRFKRVFGIPGYRWMKEQKAKRIFQAILTGGENFKEIAYDFGFASESYFYEFCKSQFGETPGQIRKRK